MIRSFKVHCTKITTTDILCTTQRMMIRYLTGYEMLENEITDPDLGSRDALPKTTEISFCCQRLKLCLEIIVQNHRGRMNEEGVFPAQSQRIVFFSLRVPDLARHIVPVNISLLKNHMVKMIFMTHPPEETCADISHFGQAGDLKPGHQAVAKN